MLLEARSPSTSPPLSKQPPKPAPGSRSTPRPSAWISTGAGTAREEKESKCVINPDAHGVEQFAGALVRVGVARKGWLTREDVMNFCRWGRIEQRSRKALAVVAALCRRADAPTEQGRLQFPLRHEHRQTFAGAAGPGNCSSERVTGVAAVLSVATSLGAPSGNTMSRPSTTALQEKCTASSSPTSIRSVRCSRIALAGLHQKPPESRRRPHPATDRNGVDKSARRPALTETDRATEQVARASVRIDVGGTCNRKKNIAAKSASPSLRSRDPSPARRLHSRALPSSGRNAALRRRALHAKLLGIKRRPMSVGVRRENHVG